MEENPTGKVATIISMFEKGLDAKEIAKTLRFSSNQEMADYMKSKDYLWDNQRKNYKKIIVVGEVEPNIDKKHGAEKKASISDSINEYEDILKLLSENKSKLVKMFQD